ncbi:drug resistance transporter, EmrB/QacA subfamily [Streptomyces sp. DvalAA-14]|uniref:MDR family MFS transporter n=1 Tax=unclassified Streptomyces TaxID=2593676 RepID=UPI00081B9A6A|nr:MULTISPECIES: MDR family MFS transporter [unclassified Streptomyces]MYS21388.1 DHA2 family efflux MFS transporter permease subunit [Streptomyces sp. SID4948]SCD91306.1 drug resistance transporter, EmrB/QacA subfamily [Streptomyces sp. DvalAA-14]
MSAQADAASTGTAAPPAAYSHRQIMVILSGLLLGMFLAALDQTVVSTAIYKIGESLNGLTAQAWVTTSFLITSTIATPLYGKLSDQYGRKPFFLFAIAVFIIGSALCMLSTSMYMLAGFRAFQGIGAGGLFSLAFAIVGDIIPPRERAKYQGYFMAVFATSSVLGPVVGGALAGQDQLLGIDGWRWIFLINVPIGVVALIVVGRVLHVKHDPRKHRVDYPGAVALIVALVPLLIIAEQGREWGWGSATAFACYIIGAIGIVGFLFAERRAGDEALLPMRLFRNGVFSLGSAQSAIIGIGMFGGITLLPLYLQLVKGNSPTKAGLLTLPLVIGIMILSMVSGQVTSRTGRYKIFPIIGSVLLVAGMLMLWQMSADSGLLYVDAAMFVVGAGLGFNMQTIVLAMQNAVPPRDIGVATSSTTFFRQMGGTLGVAVFLSIVYSLVGGKIGSAFADARGSAAFQQAAKAHPDQLKTLTSASSGGTGTLNNTSFLGHIDPVLAHPFKVGFTEAINVAFLVGAAVLVIAFVLACLMKEVPLRTTAAAFAEKPEGLAGPTPDDTTAPAS